MRSRCTICRRKSSATASRSGSPTTTPPFDELETASPHRTGASLLRLAGVDRPAPERGPMRR